MPILYKNTFLGHNSSIFWPISIKNFVWNISRLSIYRLCMKNPGYHTYFDFWASFGEKIGMEPRGPLMVSCMGLKPHPKVCPLGGSFGATVIYWSHDYGIFRLNPPPPSSMFFYDVRIRIFGSSVAPYCLISDSFKLFLYFC